MENSAQQKPATTSPPSAPMPIVGVGVFLLKGSKVLLGKRLSAIGHSTFAIPGGYLEFGESFEECVRREMKEETGLEIDEIDTNSKQQQVGSEEGNVYAVIVDPNQQSETLEPEKCAGWDWYEWNNLPNPLFGPLQDMIQSGFNPFP